VKQFLVVVAAVGLLTVAAVAQANTAVTLTFSGDALINQYASGTSAVDPNARSLQKNWGVNTVGEFANTWGTTYADYTSWAGSVTGEGNGISAFSTWFQGGAAGSSWGENVVIRKNTIPTATAPTGWAYTVTETSAWYGGSAAGYYEVDFYATDPAYYIKTGSTVGDFSITSQLAHTTGSWYWPENTGHAVDGDVLPGENIQMWFGTANGPAAYPPPAIWFGSGWSEGWASVWDTTGNGGTGLQGNIPITAVPEPGTLMLCALAVLGFMAWRKR
jgi:hypothetical protein